MRNSGPAENDTAFRSCGVSVGALTWQGPLAYHARTPFHCFQVLAGKCEGEPMTDWVYVQEHAAEQLAQLYYFSFIKHQNTGEVPFRITIKEFASPPPGQRMRFFAEADKAVNQKTAPFVPCGWGNTIFNALGDCVRLIRQFPYEGGEPSQAA